MFTNNMHINDLGLTRAFSDSIAIGITGQSSEEIEKPEVVEEWIWVDGYKATDMNMRCRGYQYAIGSKYDMPEDSEIKACESGFHLCKNLKDVFEYYSIGEGNRYFKVSALVRKSDYDKAGTASALRVKYSSTSPYGMSFVPDTDSKLAAKSIIFTEELTVYEILKAAEIDMTDWTEEEKKMAIDQSIKAANDNVLIRQLEAFGYNRDMAKFIIDEGKFKKAYALGKQPDISMETRIKCIFK